MKYSEFRRGDENRPYPSVLASTRLNGTHPIPAPSMRELSSECETEGVYYDERKLSKISEPIKTVRKPSAWNNHRTTLPQSRPVGRASSLREGAGEGFHHPSGYSLKSQVTGDFHRPYGTLMILAYTIQRRTLPQSRPLGVPAPSEREPGIGFHHPSDYSLKSQVTGDFHRPYGTLRILAYTIHRTTLPQSRPAGVPAPSEREPGNAPPCCV